MKITQDKETNKLFETMKLNPTYSKKKLASLGFGKYFVERNYMPILRIVKNNRLKDYKIN